jgi:6-pyruvoyltetrahydropterin/6-carboxytetrahydropterin synthase
MRISKQYTFDASHQLTQLPHWHKCQRLHGHTYTVVIELTGRRDPSMGWVQDYSDIDKAMRPLLEILDHRHLNEVDGMACTTAECISVWIWDRLKVRLPLLSMVSVSETPKTRADYCGDET